MLSGIFTDETTNEKTNAAEAGVLWRSVENGEDDYSVLENSLSHTQCHVTLSRTTQVVICIQIVKLADNDYVLSATDGLNRKKGNFPTMVLTT